MFRKDYNPAEIEPKWQDIWDAEAAFVTRESQDKPRCFYLVEFPYPSGAGLHVGHPRPYTAMDILARKRRMEGYDVLFPMGWDAFGLPTENFAIKNNIHPAIITQKNIDNYRRQMKMLGLSFDWTREVDTTNPDYYKWTQWIFIQLFKHGLAYKAEMPINWCTSCNCGLANEEVVNGVCERCGGEVVRKIKSQWMLSITKYAQKLLDGLDEVDYIDIVKTQQRNWIGRSEGAEVDFKLADSSDVIRVYTTRPDTLFGATYMVLSPEHHLIDKLSGGIKNMDEVIKYREAAARKSDFERTELQKEKTGVCLSGISAINPVTQQPIPVWISDYVLTTYGTGAIMAVPGHDSRDWEFAKKFGLPITEVVAGGEISVAAFEDIDSGVMVNSGEFNGMNPLEAKAAITEWIERENLGKKKINFKLRDWVFSRQRYWGEPIPLVHCDACGWVPVPDEQLPLRLPELENFAPGEDGESALAGAADWVHTVCPACGGAAVRETDTMPQWAGSSWYFLRYCDAHNDKEFASMQKLQHWMPVDWYNGGMEHTTLHLLYSRFWHHFLYDIGLVPTAEPYKKRTSHGMILGENGEKMSKSKGNVVNPDDIVRELGADAFRTYIMFIGAFDQAIPWSDNGVRGCRRFLDRVWRLQDMLIDGGIRKEMAYAVHTAIKKVTDDIHRMKFNTAVAALMSLVNEFYEKGNVTKHELEILLKLLSLFAPHMCEEIWQVQGYPGRLYNAAWPEHDESALQLDTIEIAVQINGKVRGRIDIASGLTVEEAQSTLPQHPKVLELLNGASIKKLIFVPGRILNIVV